MWCFDPPQASPARHAIELQVVRSTALWQLTFLCATGSASADEAQQSIPQDFPARQWAKNSPLPLAGEVVAPATGEGELQ